MIINVYRVGTADPRAILLTKRCEQRARLELVERSTSSWVRATRTFKLHLEDLWKEER